MRNVRFFVIMLSMTLWPLMNYAQQDPGNNGNGTSVGNFSIGLEGNELAEVQVYPNPVHLILYIARPPSMTSELTLELYSIIGIKKEERQIKDPKNEIDISAYPSGLYILKLKGKYSILTKRIVIE